MPQKCQNSQTTFDTEPPVLYLNYKTRLDALLGDRNNETKGSSCMRESCKSFSYNNEVCENRCWRLLLPHRLRIIITRLFESTKNILL